MATVGLSLDIFCRGLLRELSTDYELIALASPDSHLDELGRREGVRHIGVAMQRNISPLSDLRSLIKLIRVFRRERPDIVHTMTPKAGLLGMIAARIAHVPIRIHTFTGLLFPTASGLRKLILTTTDRITCRCATHIIPEGEGVKSDLINHRITGKPMNVLGHGNVRGVNLEHYILTPEIASEAGILRQKLGIPEDANLLVYVGRFVVDKGMRELISAFTQVNRDDTHLLLVGDIEGVRDDVPLKEFMGIPNLHLSGGWVNDVRPWLAAADLFVFPSYREGFPNVVLEAGAMGLPSVVTDINGSREIITDGMNGFIVPTHDAISLHRAITKFLDSPAELKHKMGENARRNVAEKFSERLVRDSLKQFYNEITNDRGIR